MDSFVEARSSAVGTARLDGHAASPAAGVPGRWATVVDDYLRTLSSLLQGIDRDRILEVAGLLRTARDAGRTLFVAGNGGSAATATHLANDLGKATKRSGQRPVRVLSLSDNVSWFSALANDEGYERVFSGQLENFAEPGDVLIVISASGNSPNLVNATHFAHQRGMIAIGLLGFDGGVLKNLVDEVLWVETAVGMYGVVESAHVVVADLLTSCLIEDPREEVEWP